MPRYFSSLRLAACLLLGICFSLAAMAQVPFWKEPPPTRPKLSPASEQKAKEGLFLLDGTPVKLKLMRDLSSATEQVGATVDFAVLEDVEVDEKVVIKQGAVALGKVTSAIPKRRMGRTGKLEIQLETVTLADGTRLPIRSVNTAVDGSRAGTVATATTVVGIAFFPAAPLVLLVKGKDVNIPQGTFVTAYINGEHKLDPTKFTISGGQNYATVNFKSEIEAELWIDDKFVGNVPASIRLPEGEYQVAAYQPGYRRWIRKITVTAGSLMNLTVVLEKDEVKK